MVLADGGINGQRFELLVPERLADPKACVVLQGADPHHLAHVVAHEAEVWADGPVDDRHDFFDRKRCTQVGPRGVAATASLPPATEAMKDITFRIDVCEGLPNGYPSGPRDDNAVGGRRVAT